jgi:homoserine dehydrogenase
MRILNTALIGLGNVGRNFLRILATKRQRIADQYGLEFRIICAADSSGAAVDLNGFDSARLCSLKERNGHVRELPSFARGLMPAAAMENLPCDLLFDASPVNLLDGEPGLGACRAALGRGVSVVLANKAPLVLAFHELHALAHESGAGLAYSATVCGALPVINIGQRDLVAAEITLLRGIFNSTTNFILAEMATGRSFADALAEAQRRGIAERDPILDVEGWDTANKLVIIANSFLGTRATLSDVQVTGVTGVTTEQLRKELARGATIKLLASAVRVDDGYQLRVEPTALPNGEFLAGCNGWEMGVEMVSDLYGRMYHKIWEREPLPTAAAMLRDAVNLFL